MIPGWAVLRQAVIGWWNDNALSRGASIAFFTIFSLAPVLFIAIAVAGIAFGRAAAQGAIVDQLSGLMGHHTSKALQQMISGTYRERGSIPATAAGIVTLLVTATSAFAEIQSALNEIWCVTPPASTPFQLLRTRLVSLGLVLTLGFVLLVSLVLSAAMGAVGNRLEALLPGMAIILRGVNAGISLVLIAILFGAIYKVLPDREIRWRDALVGATATTVLFTAGKYGIGFYIGSTSISSSYGAAGALIVLLLWIYFSATIFLFGAEVARVYADRHAQRQNRPEAVLQRRSGGAT